MNRREQIVSDLIKEKQHLSVITDNKIIKRSISDHIKYLTKQLDKINSVIDGIILHDEDLRERGRDSIFLFWYR